MKEHQWAGLIIFVLGIFGFSFNMFVVILLRKARSLKNAFGILTFNQAITDLINSTIFAFIVAPFVFFIIPVPFSLTARLGQLLFLAYDCCSWSHLCITLNRFCSLYFPHKYHILFSNRATLYYALCIWVIAICINFYEYVFVDCSFWLPISHWNFEFKGGPSCADIEWYLNYCRNMFITAFIALLDTATLVKFHFVNQKTKNTNIDNKAQKKRRRQELFFLAQAIIQSTLFYIELVCCYNLGALPWMSDPWAQFALRTICWVLIHGLDGLITLLCNGDLRGMILQYIFCVRKSSECTSSDGHIKRAWPSICDNSPSATFTKMDIYTPRS